MIKLTMDFETRSTLDIKKVGGWLYSRHPSTDVLCLGWHLDDFGGQWRMGQPPPLDLFADLALVNVVEAHNSFFELSIWNNVCVARYGWPDIITFDMWRCSASKAAAMSIPRGLGDAGNALGLKVVKEEENGKRAMLKLSKPRKPTKLDASPWHDGEDDWQKMLAYNLNDVAAEEELSNSLPDLSPAEIEVWRASERMNLRGFPVDVAGVRKAVALAGEYARRLTAEFHDVTGLDTAGQRAKFTVWLATEGVQLADTTAGTLDAVLKTNLRLHVRRAIEIVRTLGRSSIKKYMAMLAMADTDGRVRGCFMYHGANTGRWAGKGVQPQNFPRAYVMEQDEAWELIHENDLDVVDMIADPLQFLSGALRGAICAPSGRQFYCADFAQIEVRVLFWLAGETRGLDIFRSGRDIYLDAASLIYGRKIHKHETLERFLGKQATLALGFGAGFVKYLVHCRALGAPPFTMNQVRALVPPDQYVAIAQWIRVEAWKRVLGLIPDADESILHELVLTKYVVDKYRTAHKTSVVALWTALENAARFAIQNPTETFSAGKIKYKMSGRFLRCRLPSGRIISYYDPQVKGREITYMTVEEGQWRRTKTYGGKLAENVTQAAARDAMSDAMLRLEKTVYRDIVLTVHDELASEVDEGAGNLEEFLAIVGESPAWAPDLPVKAEGWSGRRYRK